MAEIDKLFELLVEHENKFHRSFSLIPSENIPSPLSRLGFLSDGFSRYFFDEKEVFGRWSFEGGSIVGRIQQEILLPLFREVGRAKYVNLHPVSGLTGMTLGLAAFGGPPGSRVFSVPVSYGGHPDTAYVGAKLAYEMRDIPFTNWKTLDVGAFADAVAEQSPRLIYIDHATALFPLDLAELVRCVREAAREHVHIHVDTSHVNGLVWAGLLPHPLQCGADSYGGSTHKTFPGPHKAVLFTNDDGIFEKLTLTAVNMISHHHMGSVIALAIALIEFVECDGRGYARQILRNARAFAESLDASGISVEGKEDGFTRSHQVWFKPPNGTEVYAAASRLFEAGFVVNPYNPIPSLGGPGIRTGLNEPTRLGMVESDLKVFAKLIASLLLENMPVETVASKVAELRARARPAFCYPAETIQKKWRLLASAFHDDRGIFYSEKEGFRG